MKQALILHGTDATPASNWFTWLKKQLEQDDYTVWLPQPPNSDKPNTKTYNQFLLVNSLSIRGSIASPPPKLKSPIFKNTKSKFK